MKIAYVLNTYPQPSHSFIRREIRALERRGAEVSRIAMRRTEAELVDPGDIEEQAKTEYVLEHGAGTLGLSLLRSALQSPARLWRAARLARKAGAGVLRHMIYLAEAAHVRHRAAALGITHLHAHFGTNAAAVAMLAHELGGPPFSFTVHGPEEFDAPRALSLGDKAARAAFTVAISQFGRSQLRRWTPLPDWPRLKVVHCGIEPQLFPEPSAMPSGPIHFVNIGRFHEQKGQAALIEAMAQLVETHPDARLTLVGDGEMRGEIEASIARLGLAGNVTLAGWLSEEGVRAALAAAHVLALPSFAEGLPMVIMEAMAAGRAVISTYIAGIPELVQPGETGWLVPAGDIETLTEAMRSAAETPRTTLAEMGAKGRVRALQRHDIDTEAGKLLAHFEAAAGFDPSAPVPNGSRSPRTAQRTPPQHRS